MKRNAAWAELRHRRELPGRELAGSTAANGGRPDSTGEYLEALLSTRCTSRAHVTRNVRAEVCVGAAIVEQERILLLHRSPGRSYLPGRWDIPGGHVEEGESPERALRREVREETGFDVEIEQPAYVSIFPYRTRSGGRRTTIAVDFLCRRRRPARLEVPRLHPAEHTDFVWAARRDLWKYPTSAVLARTIRAAFALRGDGPDRARRSG